jgi:hypothetical protein
MSANGVLVSNATVFTNNAKKIKTSKMIIGYLKVGQLADIA